MDKINFKNTTNLLLTNVQHDDSNPPTFLITGSIVLDVSTLDKDTIIDNSGTIIQDKNIRFVKLSIDNCILSDDDEFFYSTFGTPGLWSTDALMLDFEQPFMAWYSQTSNKNTKDQSRIADFDISARATEFVSKLSTQLKDLVV